MITRPLNAFQGNMYIINSGGSVTKVGGAGMAVQQTVDFLSLGLEKLMSIKVRIFQRIYAAGSGTLHADQRKMAG